MESLMAVLSERIEGDFALHYINSNEIGIDDCASQMSNF